MKLRRLFKLHKFEISRCVCVCVCVSNPFFFFVELNYTAKKKKKITWIENVILYIL